jgi:DNA polymerase
VTAAADTAAAKSLLAFWAEVGVDVAMSDMPIDRMAEGRKRLQAPRTPAAPKPAAPTIPAARAHSADVVAAAADARALAAAAKDLDALKEAIANFEGCPLRFSGATQAVFARGDPNAAVMVIGEGPGADEDRQGAPFVGRAGKLLDKMLAAAGLADQVFITNSVFWRPPGNRTPTVQEQLACAPFVQRAIALVKPKVLLLSGGASAKFMLGRAEGILSLRGRRIDWTSEDGSLTLPALPTLHPAFLLRQPAAKKHAWADLLALRELLSESN